MPDEDDRRDPLGPIRNPLIPGSMDDGDGAHEQRDEAELLRLFVGKNADMFARVYEGQVRWEDKAFRKSLSPVQRIRFNWRHSKFNWPVFFAFPVWFFYRKLWIEGAALIVIPLALATAFPALGKGLSAMSFLLGWSANGYYVWRTRKRIAAIEADGGPEEERDGLIRARGGTSVAGMILGLLIFATMAGAGIYGIKLQLDKTDTAKILPGCESADVRKMTSNIVFSSLNSRNIPTTGVSLSGFREITATPDMRTCAMTLKAPGEQANFRLQVTWKNREKGDFQVGISRAP